VQPTSLVRKPWRSASRKIALSRRCDASPFFGEKCGGLKLAHLSTADGAGIELFQFIKPKTYVPDNTFDYGRTGIFHMCITAADIETKLRKSKRTVANLRAKSGGCSQIKTTRSAIAGTHGAPSKSYTAIPTSRPSPTWKRCTSFDKRYPPKMVATIDAAPAYLAWYAHLSVGNRSQWSHTSTSSRGP
jgi:hypothetical protein